MIYVIEPTPAKGLKPGDTFRDGGQTLRVREVEGDEITYSIEPSELVNHFFALPDDVVDRIRYYWESN